MVVFWFIDFGFPTAQGPLALRLAKAACDQGLELGLEDGMAIEKEKYGHVLGTKDRLEGLAAFSEKRPPQYTGE